MLTVSEEKLKAAISEAYRSGADTGALAILTAMEIGLASWKVQLGMRLFPKRFIRGLRQKLETDLDQNLATLNKEHHDD